MMSPTQKRQDAQVLSYMADAICVYIDAESVSLHDWVIILDAATNLRRKQLPLNAGGTEDEDAAEAAAEESALEKLFQKAESRLLEVGLVVGKTAAGAAVEGELSFTECVSLLLAFARHPSASVEVAVLWGEGLWRGPGL